MLTRVLHALAPRVSPCRTPLLAGCVHTLAAPVVQAAGTDVETYSETRPAALRGVGSWVSRATTEDAQPGEPTDSRHITSSRTDASAAATYEYYGRSVRSFLFRTAVFFILPIPTFANSIFLVPCIGFKGYTAVPVRSTRYDALMHRTDIVLV